MNLLIIVTSYNFIFSQFTDRTLSDRSSCLIFEISLYLDTVSSINGGHVFFMLWNNSLFMMFLRLTCKSTTISSNLPNKYHFTRAKFFVQSK